MKDISGQRFGKLVAMRFMGRSRTKYYWLFKCDCGNEKVLPRHAVIYKSSKTSSCDCIRRKLSEGYHGMGQTRFYQTYRNLWNRCNYSKHIGYQDYGGRGIKCLWDSFNQFRDDMYLSYFEHIKQFGEKDTQIERIDNNGNYCRENCKWATRKEQGRNKRSVRPISFNGKTQLLTDWARALNTDAGLMHWRLKHWSIEKALTTPIKR